MTNNEKEPLAMPPSLAATFEVCGTVFEVLRGCGLASFLAADQQVYTVDRATDGIDFDILCKGQRVYCRIARVSNRVLHANLLGTIH